MSFAPGEVESAAHKEGRDLIDEALMAILRCPGCRADKPLVQDGDFLNCTACGRRYPIVDGIPHLIVEDAEEAKPGK